MEPAAAVDGIVGSGRIVGSFERSRREGNRLEVGEGSSGHGARVEPCEVIRGSRPHAADRLGDRIAALRVRCDKLSRRRIDREPLVDGAAIVAEDTLQRSVAEICQHHFIVGIVRHIKRIAGERQILAAGHAAPAAAERPHDRDIVQRVVVSPGQ